MLRELTLKRLIADVRVVQKIADEVPTGERLGQLLGPATLLRSAEIHHGVGKIAKPDLGAQPRLSRIKRIGLEASRR